MPTPTGSAHALAVVLWAEREASLRGLPLRVVGNSPSEIPDGTKLLEMINSKAARVRRRLDEVWFCEIDETERVQRLVARHEEFGGCGYSGRRV